ncbi:DnaJ sub B member 13 [Dinochytrium kinnereticum]|nr:DnaJ sub B member 13 [Dinochytrium kinnereticum]
MDYYKVLQVERSADSEAVRRAYRRLSLKHHPDKNPAPDSFENFKRIAEAYDVLSNSKRRAVYDQYGPDGLKNGVPQRDDFDGYSGGYAFNGDPEEVFVQFFGGKNPFAETPQSHSQRHSPHQDFFAVHTETTSSFPAQFGNKFGGMHGMNRPNPAISPPVQDPPIEKDLNVTLEELYNGAVKKVKILRKVFGDDGVTTQEAQKVLTIDIKRGWKDGTRVIFPSEGDQGPNRIPADIVFTIRELGHDRFKREGDNLVHVTDITLGKALSGSTVEVKTLDDRVLTIPINDIVK